MKGKLVIFLIGTLLVANSVHAQKSGTPYLERSITVSLSGERMDAALKKIGDLGGFSFSYNPDIVETARVVNYDFNKKSVREVLDQLFQGSIEYKIRGKHIILTKAKTSSKLEDQILTGYVIDEATGEKLKNVSVYDPVTLSSAVTDSYGYFEIKLNKPSTDVVLSVNKQNYGDTAIAVRPGNGRLLNIPIKVNKEKFVTVADSIGQKLKRFWNTKVLHPPLPNIENINDTLYRTFQFSAVPFIGTNHLLSGNVINDYSFNLLGGYNLGVQKAELGGIFNINRGNVTGAQVAGLFNAVGGKMEGLQLAGLFNANYENFEGGQIAGLINLNWGSTSMFSTAGLANFTRGYSRGVHIAGLSNFTIGEQQGPHVAGLFNFTTEDAGPAQVAGAFNFAAKNFEGSQLAGVFNFTAKDVQGSQLAGVINFSGKQVRGSQISGVLNFAGKGVKGSQIAGVLNFGGKVRGSQLGLVNIADSVRGASIGLFSFVMKGYHKLEFSADEIFYTNVAFRTGVRNFYNIFTAGAKPDTFKDDFTYWTFGYGFGTAPRLSRKLFLNLDITANQVVDHEKIEALNLLNKVYIGFDYQIVKGISFTFGGTLNGYVTETSFDNYKPLFTDYEPHVFFDKNYSGNDLNLKMWWGAKAGLRFF